MNFKRKKVKIISLILSLCMVISLVPFTASAVNTAERNLEINITSPSATTKNAEDLYKILGGSIVADLYGDKVTLKRDVYIKRGILVGCEKIVLNLNSNSLFSDDISNNIIQVRSGDFVIEDETNLGEIGYSKPTNSYVLCANTGNVTLTGGTVHSINAMGGSVKINGGSVTTNQVDGAVKITSNSKVIMNGGIISSRETAVKLGDSYTGGSFTINNGKIISRQKDGIFLLKGSVTVRGGHIESLNLGKYDLYAAITCYTPDLIITGGVIEGEKTGINIYSKLNRTISGGTFIGKNAAIKSTYDIKDCIKEGYVSIDRELNIIKYLGTCVKDIIRIIPM